MLQYHTIISTRFVCVLSPQPLSKLRADEQTPVTMYDDHHTIRCQFVCVGQGGKAIGKVSVLSLINYHLCLLALKFK